MARMYQLLCGNLDCPTRTRRPDGVDDPHLFDVREHELVDGEVWLCPDCRAAGVWVTSA